MKHELCDVVEVRRLSYTVMADLLVLKRIC